MTVDAVMARLAALGSEKMRAQNARNGAGENQFGVKMGDLRTLAKEIKLNPELAEELWASGNTDAMLLATLLMKPKQLSSSDLDRLVSSISYFYVADWLGSYVIKAHPDKESKREKWMNSKHEMTKRVGWSLTAERIAKNPNGLDIPKLLDRLEKEMPKKPNPPKWTMNIGEQWPMNVCLAEIGINFPEHRNRAIAIAEKIGAFRDYPVSKGLHVSFRAELDRRDG
jgi:3-methyladenine DNA glycosylase AlkD